MNIDSLIFYIYKYLISPVNDETMPLKVSVMEIQNFINSETLSTKIITLIVWIR